MPNYPTAHGEVSRIAGQRNDVLHFITVMGRILSWATIPSRKIGHQEVLP